jgi:hypothetical protein
MTTQVIPLVAALLVTAAVASTQPIPAPAASLSATIATGQASPVGTVDPKQAPLPTLQVTNNNDRAVNVLVFMEDDGSYIWGKSAGRGKTEVFEFPASVVGRPMSVVVFDNADFTAFRSRQIALTAGQRAILVVQDDLTHSQLTVK